MGARGGALARCGESLWPVVRRAPQGLAGVHRHGDDAAEPRAAGARSRRHDRPGARHRFRRGCRHRDAGRRGTGRSGIADLARRARAAIRRRDPVRRSRLATGARLRAARGAQDPGRQDRAWARLQAERYQRADGEARAGGPPRRSSQGRRSVGVRPRDRGDRGLPRSWYRGDDRAGNFRGAGRGVRPWRSVDRTGSRAPRAVRHGACEGRQPARSRLAQSRRSGCDHGGLHAARPSCRASGEDHCRRSVARHAGRRYRQRDAREPPQHRHHGSGAACGRHDIAVGGAVDGADRRGSRRSGSRARLRFITSPRAAARRLNPDVEYRAIAFSAVADYSRQTVLCRFEHADCGSISSSGARGRCASDRRFCGRMRAAARSRRACRDRSDGAGRKDRRGVCGDHARPRRSASERVSQRAGGQGQLRRIHDFGAADASTGHDRMAGRRAGPGNDVCHGAAERPRRIILRTCRLASH